jgi:hypothetical protein
LVVIFSLKGNTSTFLVPIPVVVCFRTKEQVVWIDTLRVVTLMTNKHPLWYRPDIKFIRDSVSLLYYSVVSDVPISASVTPCFPNPTTWSYTILAL